MNNASFDYTVPELEIAEGSNGKDDFLCPDSGRSAEDCFAWDVIEGLSRQQKSIPARYLYDDLGSKLYEALCEQPEHYPTRVETALLDSAAVEIAELTGGNRPLVEFGGGANRNTRILLDAMPQVTHYVPIDSSCSALHEAQTRLAPRYPGLRIEPVLEDFTDMSVARPAAAGRAALGYLPGSAIGNFTPDEAVKLLARWRRLLGRGSWLLLGVDLVKDGARLKRAYHDAAGISAAFNLNILRRINAELGGDFSTARFDYAATWNEQASRMEMHLVSRYHHRVTIGRKSFNFDKGETIHTATSYKYEPLDFIRLARCAGWDAEKGWLSHDPSYALVLMRAVAVSA